LREVFVDRVSQGKSLSIQECRWLTIAPARIVKSVAAADYTNEIERLNLISATPDSPEDPTIRQKDQAQQFCAPPVSFAREIDKFRFVVVVLY
jgi:hypothetical protein